MPIVNATVITVSMRGPSQITTSDVEVDAFTFGHRCILYIDCSPADAPGNPITNDDVRVKKDPEDMSADELAFYQQVQQTRLEIKQEGHEMALMDVDDKAILESVITDRFTKPSLPLRHLWEWIYEYMSREGKFTTAMRHYPTVEHYMV